jgi:hypothetical protein
MGHSPEARISRGILRRYKKLQLEALQPWQRKSIGGLRATRRF